jgi:hypothetical protein
MKNDPQPGVLEAGEATPGTLDLLDAQVEALGRAVGGAGAVMVQNLGPQALEGISERSDLLDLVALASDDGLVATCDIERAGDGNRTRVLSLGS